MICRLSGQVSGAGGGWSLFPVALAGYWCQVFLPWNLKTSVF